MDDVVAALRAGGCVFAESEAALLRAEATSDDELVRMVADRVAGTPLEHVVGWAEFCGLRIRVRPGVFVPRRRTSYLVELATPFLKPDGVAVDLCCGSGAVAAALASRMPDVDVFAADIDPAAVACAGENLSPEQVFEGDLYDALPQRLPGRIDVLVANAPYVPTDFVPLMPAEARDHEPRFALDGGVDGLDVVRRIAGGAREWLAPGGVVIVETSGVQADEVLALVETVGLSGRIERDEELAATAVVGRRGH